MVAEVFKRVRRALWGHPKNCRGPQKISEIINSNDEFTPNANEAISSSKVQTKSMQKIDVWQKMKNFNSRKKFVRRAYLHLLFDGSGRVHSLSHQK